MHIKSAKACLLQDEKCQIMSLSNLSETPSFFQIAWQRVKNLKWTFGRRIIYLQNWIMEVGREIKGDPKCSKEQRAPLVLKPGDLVKVKSEKEIKKTLNRWNKLKGCGVMDGMWKYCGTEQRVLKVVKQFLDERDYLMKKCKGIVILEGVICNGTRWFGTCDRSCYYFWREEWIEKIE
ncbi:MAG: hypothetical protein ABFD08_12690 [Syntrophomonas sp.]